MDAKQLDRLRTVDGGRWTGRPREQSIESFRGLLVPLLLRMVEKDTRRGFEEMNQALKTRAEQAVA